LLHLCRVHVGAESATRRTALHTRHAAEPSKGHSTSHSGKACVPRVHLIQLLLPRFSKAALAILLGEMRSNASFSFAVLLMRGNGTY
jgi:hypothetical protein